MVSRIVWLSVLTSVVALAGCGDPESAADGGVGIDAATAAHDAGGSGDATVDAHVSSDAMVADASLDAASSDSDAGVDGGNDAGREDTDAGAPHDAGTDSGPRDAGPRDAGSGRFDVRVRADGPCSELSFDPPSIAVPAGSSFTVNWINATGCTEIDIDMGGTVPIVIGLEPGTSYHDTIREWCGSYTGTYFFRAYYSPSFPAYLDVDCSG